MNSHKILLVPLALVSVLLSLSLVLAAAPAAVNDAYTVNEDTTLTVAAPGVLGNDTDTDIGDVLTAISTSNPTKGTLTFNANGGFTYKPNANVNGVDTFKYKANDGTSNSTEATVTLTITAVNDAPVISLGTEVKLKVGVAYSASIATDVDDASPTYTVSTGWTGLPDISSGQISFTPTDDDFGAHDVTFTVKDAAGATATKAVKFIVSEDTDDGSLTINGLTVDDATGESSKTAPGDDLDLDFDLKNAMSSSVSESISGIKIEAWLDDNGDRVGDKFEPDQNFDINAKDSETVKFTFKVDPEAESKTYNLIIRAEGEDDAGNTKTVMTAKSVKITRESHDIYIESLAVTPNPAVCGAPADFAVHIWNVGKNDEDDVHVKVSNTELKISTDSSKFAIDKSGSHADDTITVSVNIPSSAKAGNYPVVFTTNYNSDGYSESQTATLQVICESPTAPTTSTTGNVTGSVPTGTGALLLAQTSVTADIGQKIKLTATLTNTQGSDVNYKLSVLGAADWADVFVEPTDITLAPGTSIPVYIYLTPKAGSYGAQQATVSITSGTAVIGSKTITVALPEKPTTTIKPGTGVASTGLTATLGKLTLDTNTLVALAFVIALALFGVSLARNYRTPKVEVIKSEKKK